MTPPFADRSAVLAAVLAEREAKQTRPLPVRAATAIAGLALAVGALPLVALVPELGIPLLLVALRLLAAEFTWAAHAYAWVIWRWEQAKQRYHRLPVLGRALVVLALLALAALLIWLLIRELA